MSLIDLVGIGDLHLGPGPRSADRYAALDQIVDAQIDNPNLGAWIFLGDLFHAASTTHDRTALARRLARMLEHAPVLLLQGNHDGPGELDIYALLGGPNLIKVITRPEVVDLPLSTGTGGAFARIACLPYPHKGGLVAAGSTAATTLDEAREALRAVIQGLAADLAESDTGDLPLFAGHVNVGGALASVGQPQIGREIELDPEMLERLGDIPKILGHIHQPQEIHGAVYAGSVCPMDFGEIEDKRYLVVRYEAGRSARVLSQPLQVPALYHVEGVLTPDGFTWRVTKGLGGADESAPSAFAGADVRVRFAYRPAEREALDFAAVEAPFVGARLVKLDPVPILDQALRAPAVAAAVTLEDQIRAYCAESGWLQVTDSLLAKLQQITAPVPRVDTPAEVAS